MNDLAVDAIMRDLPSQLSRALDGGANPNAKFDNQPLLFIAMEKESECNAECDKIAHVYG